MLSYNTVNSIENALNCKTDYKWTIFSRQGNHPIHIIFILCIFHYALESTFKMQNRNDI